MRELTRPSGKFSLLRHELLRLGSTDITEDDLLAIKGLIDSLLYKGHARYEDEMAEEFGCTRDDFDEWMHDPGK